MIGVEGAHQEEEEPSHHHVAPGMSLPHRPSHTFLKVLLSLHSYSLDNKSFRVACYIYSRGSYAKLSSFSTPAKALRNAITV